MNIMDDVGAPLAVTALDLGTESMAPEWNKWVAYGTVALAYVGGSFIRTTPFIKNMGIAAFPWAAKAIYEQVRGVGARPSRLAMSHVSGRVSSRVATSRPEWAGTRLT